ncbi:MAG: mandelate racemase/muconate lactonizing enzyme family protein [Burkholderiaceae bacterium]|nr:mandelate racemase/muconate lactonizing enzyme family protein [Burkholderiaceae bacterium]MBP6813918.1 mandelate racemase/muconate lactonizing enzyme family protein [Burkholderiaceae bacterium]MBP7661180.1 mandelate racemase/muconate lactonizing enzyme family protein [Burkholderiaceae bacterium]
MADPRVTEVTTLSCSAAWRNYYFVKVTTADGTVGWSEFDEGFGSPGVGAVVQSLASRVIGQSAMQHERIREDLRGITRPGQGGVVGQALGAIENALLDAKAKILGVPCYELLGGKVRDRLRVYWSHCVTWRAARRPHYQPEITDIDGVRALAREVRDKGFTGLKTNIFRYEDGKIKGFSPGFGTPFEPGLNVEKHIVRGVNHHLSVMREAAGPEMDILLDLNFNAKTEGYLRFLRGIADQDLFWVEIDTLDPQALAYIRSQSAHPIASCETLIGVQEFLPFLRAQAIDVAIVDTPWNGVWQSMKIAAAAEAHEVNVACHNFYGHLCTMMNAHFCAAVPNLRIMEVDIDRIAWDHELFTHVPEYVDGHLVMPERPGWGTEPNEAAILAHPPIQVHGLAARARTQTV